MTIAEKIERAMLDYTAVRDAGFNEGFVNGERDGIEQGKQAEREKFWDNYQDYGNRTAYGGAFAGQGWVKTGLLPPKYPMILDNSMSTNYYIFNCFNQYGTARYDMSEICKLLDCSNAPRLNSMFENANVENITIDMSNCQMASYMFGCGMGGGSINKVYLKVTEKLTTASGMFSSCVDLETIRFTEDSVINIALSFSSSPLSKESIESIINALSPTATGKTLTLKKTAVQNAFGTDYDSSTEWTTLKNSKSNWTITLS